MGGVSDRVIHHASCPVLVVPRGAHTQVAEQPGTPANAAASP